MLGMVGTSEHLRRCGITKLRDEMKFRKLIQEEGIIPVTTKTTTTVTADRKLTKLELTQLQQGEKQTYLIK